MEEIWKERSGNDLRREIASKERYIKKGKNEDNLLRLYKIVYFIIHDDGSWINLNLFILTICINKWIPLTAFGAATGADLAVSTGAAEDFLSSDVSTLALCSSNV